MTRTVSELDQAILNALAAGPLSTTAIATSLREDPPRVKRRLDAMLQDRIVQRKGEGRKGAGGAKGFIWRIRPVER